MDLLMPHVHFLMRTDTREVDFAKTGRDTEEDVKLVNDKSLKANAANGLTGRDHSKSSLGRPPTVTL